MIRTARIENPFVFLPWVRHLVDDAQRNVSKLAGRPYSKAEVLEKGDELEQLNFLPDAGDQRFRFSLVVVSVENCSDGYLDVVYSDLSTQIAPVLSGTFESRRAESAAPERVAGADAITNRFRLSPSAGYDRAENLFAGGRMEYLFGGPTGGLPVNLLAVDGQGSTSMRRFSAALAGSKDMDQGWLAHADWQLDYLNNSEPADPSRLQQNRGAAQLAAITRPLGEWRLPLRFGGLAEGGELRSNFAAAGLPPDTEDSSGYGAAKLYVGTTTRLAHNVVAASYGIELGSTGSGVDWVKHVGDIAHEVTFPIGDHRPLEIESRLTGGLLEVPGTVPVAARFFGGNREDPFIPGDAWSIRSNPVIRSIPANEFYLTNKGPGATGFLAYNLTIAIPIWRKPLVPFELSRDPEFTNQIHGAMQSATSVVQTEYVAKDPSFTRAAARIGDVRTALANLKAAVAAAQSATPGQDAALFRACTKAIDTAERRAKAAAESKGAVQYGNVATLLSADEDRLHKVQTACAVDLNRQLSDAGITARAADLEAIHTDMEQEFSLIDQASASRQADTEMGYVSRTLTTMIHDWNLFAVSPVVMFDVAHIDPADSRLGTRYGIGGGLRVTLVSSFDFTAGYLANPTRLSPEPPGAAFFALRFKDLGEYLE